MCGYFHTVNSHNLNPESGNDSFHMFVSRYLCTDVGYEKFANNYVHVQVTEFPINVSNLKDSMLLMHIIRDLYNLDSWTLFIY